MILLRYSRFFLHVKIDQNQLFDKSYISQRTKLQLLYLTRVEEKKRQIRLRCLLQTLCSLENFSFKLLEIIVYIDRCSKNPLN